MPYLSKTIREKIEVELGLQQLKVSDQSSHYHWIVYLSYLTQEDESVHLILAFTKTESLSRGMIASIDTKLNKLINPKFIKLIDWSDSVVEKLKNIDAVASLDNSLIWGSGHEVCEIWFETVVTSGHLSFRNISHRSSNLAQLWSALLGVAEEFKQHPSDDSFKGGSFSSSFFEGL